MQIKDKQTLNVVFFAEIFPSKSETWVHNEINELKRLGCNVRVFATYPKPENLPEEHLELAETTTYLRHQRFTFENIIVLASHSKFLFKLLKGLLTDCVGLRHRAQVIRDLLYIIRFLPALSIFKPDIVISHFAGTRTNLALYYHFLSNTPFIFKMHAADVFNRPALFRLKSEKAMNCLTISEYNIKFIQNRDLDIDIQRFQKHTCGINVDEFSFLPERPKQEIPCITTVGRLVPMKGFNYLIQASHLLLEKGIKFRVVIIGDGPERNSLEKLVNELSLVGIVELAGYQPPSKIRQTLIESDIFVLPAVWDSVAGTQDGIPVALMEAMAMGVPVVSTKTSGIPELICDEVNGLLAEPANSDSLSAKLHQCLMLDQGTMNTMRRMARETIVNNHDIQKLTGHLLTMIKRGLKQ